MSDYDISFIFGAISGIIGTFAGLRLIGMI